MHDGYCVGVRTFLAYLADQLSFDQLKMLLFPDPRCLQCHALLASPPFVRRFQG